MRRWLKRHRRTKRKAFEERALSVLETEYGRAYRSRAEADLDRPDATDLFDVADRRGIEPIERNAIPVAVQYAEQVVDGVHREHDPADTGPNGDPSDR